MSENPTGKDTAGDGYDPEQDPDADPDMMASQHPGHVGENERDPAEGPEDDSATEQ